MNRKSSFMRYSLWTKRNWQNILKVALVLLLLSDGAWIYQHTLSPHIYAAAVSPQAITAYGQPTLISNTQNNGGVSTTSLGSAYNVAVDSSNNLYISDCTDNRVLYYTAGSTTATRVYGQASSFTTSVSNNNGSGVTGSTSATNLSCPRGIGLDSGGNLYVADSGNHRVLYYTAGSITATRVYGQPDLTSNTQNNNGSGVTAASSTTNMGSPYGLTLDSSNNLYVVDHDNNRVLYYASGSTTATRVYGQVGSFTISVSNNNGSGATGTPNANNLSSPFDAALDSSNNLYIVDQANNRVLYYPPGSTTATRVYGQAGSFTSNGTGTSTTGLNSPTGLAVDGGGNLYVVNTTSNNMLYFPSGTTTATRVYGQAGSFTSSTVNNGGISAVSLSAPQALCIDSSDNIYVTDNGNNRVLKFQTSLSVTTQPPTTTVPGATFSIASSLIDVGSGATFSDFTGAVSVVIKSGTGAGGAILSGTTPVSAVSGVATFSNLSINLKGTGYILTIGSSGMSSVNTNTFIISDPSIPAGYWPLNEGSGTTTADLSGNNNTGTLTGATWTTGKLNGALSFNGTSNYVSMGTPATLKFGTGSFTVMSWFKTSTTSGFNRMVSMGDSSWTPGYFTSVSPNPSGCTGCVGGGVGGGSATTSLLFYTTTSSFNDGNWHQEAMVIDQAAKTAQVYVDGVAQAVVTEGGTCGTASGTSLNITACTSLNASGTTNFTIGSYNNGINEYFNGSLDEIRVYNSALTSSLIQNQYAIDTTPSLNGYWPLNEGSGTTTADLSGNTNTGTLTGASWTTGKLNGGLSFNGTTNYVSMGTPATLKFGVGSFTVMSWFKTTGTTFGRIVSTGVSGFSNGFDLSVNTTNTCSAGCVGAEIGGGTKAATVSFGTTATTFKDGNWHQAAMVIDQTAKTAQLYVDGVAQALTTQSGSCGTASGTSVNISACISASATNSTDPFTLGAYHSGSTTSMQFTGSIDEVRVYSSALTGPQVFNQYNNDTTFSPQGYWHFDEDSGTTAYDSSPNANNGTLASTGVTWAAGKINSGLSFDGTKFVTMGTPSTLEFNNTSFSIVSWFNSTSTTHGRFVSTGLINFAPGFEFGLNILSTGGVGGNLGANGTIGNVVSFGTTATFNDGNWHQAVMVVNQTTKTVQIYVDGVAQSLTGANCGTVAGTTDTFTSCSLVNTYSTTEQFSVGAYVGGSTVTQNFIGTLDEIRIFGSPLTGPQILTIYTNDINALSENATNASFSGIVGSTVTYTLPIALTYQLTPAPGWSISITSTTLTSGVNTLPTTASNIISVTSTCTSNGTCSSNILGNTISGFPIVLPAATTAPTAVKFIGTAAGTGIGAYTVTLTISVKIPISAKLGAYSSVVTLAAAVGP